MRCPTKVNGSLHWSFEFNIKWIMKGIIYDNLMKWLTRCSCAWWSPMLGFNSMRWSTKVNRSPLVQKQIMPGNVQLQFASKCWIKVVIWPCVRFFYSLYCILLMENSFRKSVHLGLIQIDWAMEAQPNIVADNKFWDALQPYLYIPDSNPSLSHQLQIDNNSALCVLVFITTVFCCDHCYIYIIHIHVHTSYV
jgi:hypothetical protein